MSKIAGFFEVHKSGIIESWIRRLEVAFPGEYDAEKLRLQCSRYVDLIADVHIPLEEHEVFLDYKKWCELLFAKRVPIEHVLQSSMFFREAFFEKVAEIEAEHIGLVPLIAEVVYRIDQFQAFIYAHFLYHALGKIEQQDKLIEDMHADKLNLIGKMASSMAHEIRNPLTSIKGFLVLLRKILPPPALHSAVKYLDIIDNEFRNIEMQITGFLSFSRKPIAEENSEPTPINDLIEKTLLLVNPLLLNENIEFLSDTEEGLQIDIQKLALIQVFSNLLNNAIDALRESDRLPRIIAIRAFADGDYVYIRISNTGPEIPASIQASLFDPFVTGKTEGTGLGLAICKQIVERNGGEITFETNERETAFTLRFSAFRGTSEHQ
ncbi:phospho-acceptor domain-containing protein [Paenibacillus taihuensis]|uniref:histidine kinase n=1 Tax=Paenibacillus taihuensis TaxID=1156355 RepID=A0A3D9PYR9_9BACL|nr:HAMP domain-containing sensor histidine kinase [Paenibacillus taihuensis]REE55412.1 phospho-acceptor domain-containing protein [Paenibacillus taihuensis]